VTLGLGRGSRIDRYIAEVLTAHDEELALMIQVLSQGNGWYTGSAASMADYPAIDGRKGKSHRRMREGRV
jgi:hypothetical protein